MIARFSEHRRYDINLDADKVIMMATTPIGSFWTEFVETTAAQLREKREQFKYFAAECMQKGAEPCEIDLEAD